jgi:hypothetical protein
MDFKRPLSQTEVEHWNTLLTNPRKVNEKRDKLV